MTTTIMTEKELIEWANEEVAKVECQTYEIADTGDNDSIYECTTFEQKKGFGKTFIEAIIDAQKSKNDPSKWDYVPPEFRT